MNENKMPVWTPQFLVKYRSNSSFGDRHIPMHSKTRAKLICDVIPLLIPVGFSVNKKELRFVIATASIGDLLQWLSCTIFLILALYLF